MSGEPITTIIGNLTAPPELRFTASGAAVANFTVASTPRTLDRASGEWKDGEAMFIRCSIWRQPAENVAESFPAKGTRVIVHGRLRARTFTTGQGEERTVIEMDVDEVGPSLRFATVTVKKAARGTGTGSDPWATAPSAAPARSGGGSGFAEEPPF